jgi:putative methyltransferase (TIGR04325 family)
VQSYDLALLASKLCGWLRVMAKTANTSVTAQFGSGGPRVKGLQVQILNRIRSLLPPSETIQGYEHPELVEVIFQKTKAYRPKSRWNETARTVLDFGGGCGLHYKESGLDAKWAVVETPAMVARARELETDKLRFFTSIKAAADWLGDIDMVYSNGALQYTPNPEAVLRELIDLRASMLLWRRTVLSPERKTELQSSRLADNGPGRISAANKIVSYPAVRMAEQDFLEAHRGYKLYERDGFDFRFIRERG